MSATVVLYAVFVFSHPSGISPPTVIQQEHANASACEKTLQRLHHSVEARLRDRPGWKVTWLIDECSPKN